MEENTNTNTISFKELGLDEDLIDALKSIKWDKPTKIQEKVIPLALKKKDIIGLAETGSGKTGAFALPIIQSLLNEPTSFYALIITPTRELAFQIAEQFEEIGASFKLKTTVLVGGVDNTSQAISLAKKPHVIVGTPGRIVDHLENTKNFSIANIKYLVLDEADRILNMDFTEDIDKILQEAPTNRITYLFSATMTSKVNKLQRASLKNPERVEVSSKYTTVSTLSQYYMFVPQKFKYTYLMYLLKEMLGSSAMVFCSTCVNVQRLCLMCRNMELNAVPIHGQMDQSSRLNALKRIKNKQCSILIATDVASRGLDIPFIDLVINFDVPLQPKDYVHRVGRTARAGKSGKAITLVTQYDVDYYLKIEKMINNKMNEYATDEASVMELYNAVDDAERLARKTMKEEDVGVLNDDENEEDKIQIKLPKASKKVKKSNKLTKSNKNSKGGKKRVRT